MIRYVSTNGAVDALDLRAAILLGQAADGGLFMPDTLPRLDREQLLALRDRSYPEIAQAVLAPFTAGFVEDAALSRMCADAYDFEVPLERVTARRYVLRLDRGPTASFKDFAARMMARWFAEATRGAPGELVILTATSGDTGGAVAHAFHRVPGTRVVVLFPILEVSERQRKQMTTLGGNVTALGVDGKFDDCQAMVKRAFADPELEALRLTSANSINIARLLPQSAYYFHAYARAADVAAGEPILFSIPSGNFGDMMGAMLAWRMGLPIRRLVIATNCNDEFPQYLRGGHYAKVAPSRAGLSNAMNVGHPSNLARLVHVYGGWMDQAGTVRRAPDLDAMRRDIHAVSIDDQRTRLTIRDAHASFGLLLEPHGAVAWAGLEHGLQSGEADPDALAVVLETAHPAKFPEEIRAILGIEPALPATLSGLDRLPESFETIPAEYESFRRTVLALYAN